MGMFCRRHRARLPLLSTAATADMSFMLLIFFLVTTSMDTNKGLARQLPPADGQLQTTDVTADRVMTIELTADNDIAVDGDVMAGAADVGDGRLRRRVAAFVENRGDEHVICLSADRDADYATYFAVMNEITAAYNALGGRYEQHVAEEYRAGQ